jgi:Flp pilus assembly protein TadD
MSLRAAPASAVIPVIAATLLLTCAPALSGPNPPAAQAPGKTAKWPPAPSPAAPVGSSPVESSPILSPPGQPGDMAAENAPDDTVLPIPPVPPRIAEGKDYDRCLDMLESDPSGADALAATMAAGGAGEPAEHCHALAQVELGNTEDGAALLDKLAGASKSPASARAEVFGQADQAWTMAGRPQQAFASATNALKLSPDDPDLLIGHAIAGIALNRYAEADADLSHALDLDPKRADALVLRATAARNLGKLEEASADIEKAFALDGDDPDAYLERGIIRQRRGDLAGARADWEHVVAMSPDTPTGDLAQQNLALLDAGPRQ